MSAAVSLYCCLETLTEACRCMHETALQWHSLMCHYCLKEHTSGVGVVSQLLETLCHQTALYCSKLLKSEGGEGAVECSEEVHASLDTVAELLGQLLLVRETQQRLLAAHMTPSSKAGEDEGLSPCQWPSAMNEVSRHVSLGATGYFSIPSLFSVQA